MLAAVVLVVLGLVMVVGSLVALAIAQVTRRWFFAPDLRAQLQPAKVQRPVDPRR